ncbi:ubiquitin domain-containing protein 7SL RNA1-like [Camellia sinensis]|uniref:ubiquitin domain-containing protein 7SL RNA1-like n=1 Tax=Camellia sinensis TaxID=4442 RepID=UPI001036E27F|nr:ubiquitin domain-containing protein 7SL RNA1-like [Camellia sinensis]
MDVFFEPTKGRPFSIEVGYFDTVLEIKEKIQKDQGIPISKQTLIFNGQVLDEEINVHFSQILDRSRIQLVITPESEKLVTKREESPQPSPTTSSSTGSGNTSNSKKLRVMVLTKCGTRKIPVEVNAGDNVGELRKELQKLHQRLHIHLPSEGYFFIYRQNVMDEDRSFRWHHVGQGDTIEIFSGSVTGGS